MQYILIATTENKTPMFMKVLPTERSLCVKQYIFHLIRHDKYHRILKTQS